MEKQMFDLETHYALYRAHHTHPINALAHKLFVWPILFTLFLLFHFTPPLLQLPLFGSVNLSFVSALVYALTFLLLEPKSGSLAAFLSLLCWIGSGSLAARLGFSLAWKFVLATQLFCWSWQVIGHTVFEKQAPAPGYLPRVFLMEPFFIFVEVLENLFDYEPYPGFRAKITKKIEANLEEWQTSKLKKIS